MSTAILYATDALAAAFGLFLLRRFLRRLYARGGISHLPLPPGPPALPLLGNIRDIPTGRAWLGYTEHGTLFGPVSRLSVLGTHIIVIHDPKAARELLETHSAIFSDRPRLVLGGEMCGWEHNLALLRYGSRLKEYRREMHQVVGTQASLSGFHPLIETETRRFLLRVLDDAPNLQDHVRTTAGAIIVRIAYGYHIEPRGRDPLISLANEAIAQISYAAQPGAFLVDILPFLRHVPDWFPGAGFQRTAKRFRATLLELVNKPYALVKQQIACGTAEPSYLTELLEKHLEEGNGKLSEEVESSIKWSASGFYTSGADTTVSAINSFFLAMLMYPRVFARVQAEMDAVTGGPGPGGRLPTFADRPRLPYVSAIVNEVLRWAPIAPMGIPHVNLEDVEYQGYRIPKGSITMPNIWKMAHDSKVYDSPMEFYPERFLQESLRNPDSPILDTKSTKKPEQDVRDFVFGFGRRSCPGKELADATLFISMAMSIAAFDLKVPEGARPPAFEFAPGTISHPEPFSILATPRTPEVAELIRSVEIDHPWDASDAENFVEVEWRKLAERV